MVPLIVLAVVVLLAQLIGQLGAVNLRDWAVSTPFGLAMMLCFTAAAKFNSMRPDMIAMVPPFVPNPEFMVRFTGICEILSAVGLLAPRTRRIAAVSLIVFLLAVLPANIHATQAGVTLRGAPATPMVPRAALQVLFIGLLGWPGVPSRRANKDAVHTTTQVGMSPNIGLQPTAASVCGTTGARWPPLVNRHVKRASAPLWIFRRLK